MERSRADLALLTSELPTGPYPYAGIPWFSTPFGRDAVDHLAADAVAESRLARGVLAFLAAHQAHDKSAFLDSAPGKIMHETRKGEMAAMRELPFGLYYGGVDTTPLFVMLAGAYARRTGDLAFIDALWPALLSATAWIERVCDANPYGFLDYRAAKPVDWPTRAGRTARIRSSTPTAASPMARLRWSRCRGTYLPHSARCPSWPRVAARMSAAAEWTQRAERLRESRSRAFLDAGAAISTASRSTATAQLCRVRASNPGHLLYVGLPSRANARRSTAHAVARAGIHHRLGHAHAGRRRATLQPDVLPQRLGLAA